MATDMEDLITIVDVKDPDDPSYGDFKTRRRHLTAVQLTNLRPMLQKVGAYQFFSRDLSFADLPAVKEFVDSVELEEFKPTRTLKVVQEKFKGSVAGREVVIDAELIEEAFGLVDDGENISKPKGDDVSGLHAFYIKPHYVDTCQTHRGVNLAHVRGEYSYFENLVHQIQTYCCGIPEDSFMKLTQYRALDLMVRGRPVNWNRYLLQNFQDRIRRYKRSPTVTLYFAGTLTALIYKALKVDYQMVNKLDQAKDAVGGEDAGAAASPKKASSSDAITPVPSSPKKLTAAKRTPSSSSARQKKAAANRKISSPDEDKEPELASSPSTRRVSTAKKRKEALEMARNQKKLKGAQTESEAEMEDSENMDMDDGALVEAGAAGIPRRHGLLTRHVNGPVDIPEVLTDSKTYRLSTLFNQATGTQITKFPVPLTDSKDLWNKYAQYYALGQECHLEHIISKQRLEESLERISKLDSVLKDKDVELLERLQRVEDLETAIKSKDEKLEELELSLASLKAKAAGGEEQVIGDDQLLGEREQLRPLKMRFKLGQHNKATTEEDGTRMVENETEDAQGNEAVGEGEEDNTGDGYGVQVDDKHEDKDVTKADEEQIGDLSMDAEQGLMEGERIVPIMAERNGSEVGENAADKLLAEDADKRAAEAEKAAPSEGKVSVENRINGAEENSDEKDREASVENVMTTEEVHASDDMQGKRPLEGVVENSTTEEGDNGEEGNQNSGQGGDSTKEDIAQAAPAKDGDVRTEVDINETDGKKEDVAGEKNGEEDEDDATKAALRAKEAELAQKDLMITALLARLQALEERERQRN